LFLYYPNHRNLKNLLQHFFRKGTIYIISQFVSCVYLGSSPIIQPLTAQRSLLWLVSPGSFSDRHAAAYFWCNRTGSVFTSLLPEFCLMAVVDLHRMRPEVWRGSMRETPGSFSCFGRGINTSTYRLDSSTLLLLEKVLVVVPALEYSVVVAV